MDRRIWQYGDWLTAEARRHGFPVLDPLPFETLEARVAYALGIQESAPRTSEHRR
jgi:hypothetical protein